MTQSIHNPFAGIPLLYPRDQQPYYRQYCRSAEGTTVDRSPFRRMVDLWFAGLSIAARNDLEPENLSGRRTSQMVLGTVFDGADSWRINAIMLVALHVAKDEDVVSDASRMMAIANGLAAAGVPRVVKLLEEGAQAPIWNLSDALVELLESVN